MDQGVRDTAKTVSVGALAGVVTFVVVLVSFLKAATVDGPTVGTILWTAATCAVVAGALAGNYCSGADRPRVAPAIAIVGVVLALAPVWSTQAGQLDQRHGESYSGKVAYDEGFSLSFSDPPMSKTHVLELEPGDRVRIEIEDPNAATWELQLPGGQTLSGSISSSSPAAVKTTDGATYYTANQTGSHSVSIRVRPYQRATYRISVEKS